MDLRCAPILVAVIVLPMFVSCSEAPRKHRLNPQSDHEQGSLLRSSVFEETSLSGGPSHLQHQRWPGHSGLSPTEHQPNAGYLLPTALYPGWNEWREAAAAALGQDYPSEELMRMTAAIGNGWSDGGQDVISGSNGRLLPRLPSEEVGTGSRPRSPGPGPGPWLGTGTGTGTGDGEDEEGGEVAKSRNSRNRVSQEMEVWEKLVEMYRLKQNALMKRGEGPQLSVVSPLDVLRQQLIYEMARRRIKQSHDQIQANAEVLKNLGKRSVPETGPVPDPEPSSFPPSSPSPSPCTTPAPTPAPAAAPMARFKRAPLKLYTRQRRREPVGVRERQRGLLPYSNPSPDPSQRPGRRRMRMPQKVKESLAAAFF